MPDVYLSVDDLLRHERANVAIEDRVQGRSEIAVLAPHAGGIEPFTGEIARAVTAFVTVLIGPSRAGWADGRGARRSLARVRGCSSGPPT